jgi:putative ABC transport system permease protein
VTTLARRLHGAALHLLPRATRARVGAQLAGVFGEQVRDAARRDGRGAVLRIAVRELTALIRFAWMERRSPPPRPRLADDVDATRPHERRTSVFTALAQDLRYASRLLRRSPGFAAICITTVALAIGANTAIFSVLHGVMLEALPFAAPDRLVVLAHHTDGGETLDSTTPGNLYDWMRTATAFEAVAGFSVTERIVTIGAGAERLRGGLCVGPVFEVLGRGAAAGRALAASDDDPGAPRVVVLSAALAQRLFGGAAAAVGRSLTITGEPYDVVGVMPADFAFFDYDYEYWVPARFDAAFRGNRDQYFLTGLARLKPGVDIDQARTQLDTVMDAIRRDYPQYTQNATAAVAPLKDVLLDGVERRLVLLMGAAAFVLLIACANLGNLLLARAANRRREMAVRQALGAGHGRLVRQVLAETVWLAVMGGLAGLALGALLLRLLATHLPQDLPRLGGIGLEPEVLLFTAGVSVVAGFLIGIFPAVQLAGGTAVAALRDGTRVIGRSGPLRAGLVSSQLALALMLLVGAGLFARSFAALLDVPPGFASERLLTFATSIPPATYRTSADRFAFFERAATEIERLPGVRAVTMTTTLPVAGRGNGAWFNRVDRPWPADQTPPGVPNRLVRANYFDVMGIAVRRGRGFTPADGGEGRRVVVISESIARRFYPGDDPIGKRIFMGASDNRVVPDSEIVGVVADVKQIGLDEERPETVYAPHAAVPLITNLTFAVRTTSDPATLAPAVRGLMRTLDPGVPLIRMQTMDDILGRALAPTRSSMVLVAVFAAVALALAVVGVFGVLSYTVAQQTPEFGIRLALGASANGVLWLVLARGLLPVAIGAALGVAGAVGLSRFLRGLLFGVSPTDPLTLATVTLLLLITAAIAAYLPARRATRVDPVQVLREV